jgi:choline/glycine/proline betaine transport protein
MSPVVFSLSALFAIVFVGASALFPTQSGHVFSVALEQISARFGWLYILSVAFFLAFALWIAQSRYGDIRLGSDDSKPELGTGSWFAMLFSAGMGIGIVFFGVAEPIMHFESPPLGAARTREAAKQAMGITFFHWGPHAWAIYASLGLALAYFAHRKGLPLAVRSALYPLLGERIHGAAGHAVDVLAVLGTLFGLATSLGLGAAQINAGLAHVFGVEQSVPTQMLLIALITAAATASLVSGVHRGMRVLSELNMLLAGLLLLFVFAAGPTLFLLNSFADNLGNYLRSFVPRTFSTYPFTDGRWHRDWTLFYWGWWISWAPFVGMFIARISRGRTIREFVLYVLFAPSLVTFVWLTVFGDSALFVEMLGDGGIARAVTESTPTAIYALLEQLPLAEVTSVLTVVVVTLFFVTSSDSGSFVVDMLTSGGHADPPVWQRVFWGVAEGAIAATLLQAGGLDGLKAAAICTGLPFCVVLIAVCLSLVKALRAEATITTPMVIPSGSGGSRPSIPFAGQQKTGE